jgi:quercetin dioxygenase-like cupin family protein
MEEVFVRAADIPWEQVTDSSAKMRRKVLRRGPDGKPRAAIIKLEPGYEDDGHSHPRSENHFVIEGMYQSHGREYPAGSYHFIPRNEPHGPFRSPAGAQVLVIWDD